MKFPFRGLVLVVAIENFLFALEKYITARDKEADRESKGLVGYAVILIYTFASVASVIFMNKMKLRGRKRFMLENALILSLCYFLSNFIVSFSKYPRLFFQSILLIVQMFSRANMLTMILSVISIQKIETGFFFAFELIVGQVFYGLGLITYFSISSDAAINYIYYIVIFLFIGSAYMVYQQLSEVHEEVDSYPFNLWFKMIKAPLFFIDFTSFSLALAISTYSSTILYQIYPSLSMVSVQFIILSMISVFPITLILLYKYSRPIKNTKLVFEGLVLLGVSVILMIPAFNEEDFFIAVVTISPIFSQIGLALISVAALPNMIVNSDFKLGNVEFGIICDRVCSLVYGALYFGILIINLFVFIFGEFFTVWAGMAVASFCIGAFAFYYRGQARLAEKLGRTHSSLLFDEKEMSDQVDLNNWLK